MNLRHLVPAAALAASVLVTGCGADDAPAKEKAAPTAAEQQLIDTAEANYETYVEKHADALLAKTRSFLSAYEAGQDETARHLYPRARVHWESIETVAESFGDLDPKMDAREADLAEGDDWTGWHRIEKDLWPARAEDYTALTPAERRTFSQDLLANTEELTGRIKDLGFSAEDIAAGSQGLLEEVANGKVTGEEEYWSRTDLYDFQANIDGARKGLDELRGLLEIRDPELATELSERFAGVQRLLDAQKVGLDGFAGYDSLSTAEIKAFADAVNALAEPLSELTSVVSS